jgi:hypothetical protein
MDNSTSSKRAPVSPRVLGPANIEAAIGQNWRWVRDFAARAHVPIWKVGGKTCIPAEPLIQALEREAEIGLLEAPAPPTDEQELNALAQRLGLVRTRGAAR